MRLLSLVLLTLITIQPALLAEIQVTARFNPPRIPMGNISQYIVEITETDQNAQPEIERVQTLPIPQTSGLSLKNGRTSSSQQTRITNGTAEYTITQSLIIEASAQDVGKYTIPSYRFVYKGQRLQVPAATLEVVERSADAGPTRDEMIFLEADLPDSLYVGQTIPLQLKLYVAEDVRLSGLNSFDRTADGFTISELPDDHKESVEMKGGRRYRVLTWPFTLTPIQTGEQDLSFQFSLTARLPGQNRNRDPRGNSPFGGSIFDDFFGRSERLNVYTDARTIDVQPLPEDSKPDSFSGAIGDLAMEVGADTDKAVQGEPIMLSVVLKGRANFERIDGPSFPDNSDWRNYDPEKKFEPSDDLELSGQLRFDYVFIPQRAGQLEIPETRFSYFDPEQEEYVELTAPPLPVNVSPAKNTAPATPVQPTQPTTSGEELQLSKSLTAEEALLTLDYRPQPAKPVGYEILRSPKFITLNVIAGLLLIGGSVFIVRRKRQREDPSYPIRAEARQSLKQVQQAYQEALQQGDSEAFFKHGQLAIRHAATIQTGRSMLNATGSEIEALLDEPDVESCRAFFEAADANRFGKVQQKELTRAQQELENTLKAL